MYSDKDFQTFWFRYKTEGEPHGISINSFCINQGVPYKQFYAWFKKHAKEREDLYIKKGYDAEKIKEMRNDEYTRGIVDKLQNEMFDLMANKMDELPKLMQQALNYLHKFWKQVFAYRNDGEYSIDNLAAERAIRPQTIQRKGSLFFGSVQGALRSAMYNTFTRLASKSESRSDNISRLYSKQ